MRAEGSKATAENWFVGGGELGTLLRSHNWSQTPLGAVETWSDDLKTAVQILLTELDQTKSPKKTQLDSDLLQDNSASAALHQANQLNAFRVKLADALRWLTDASEIQAIAARILGESLGATRVIYIEVVSGGEEVIVHRHYTNGVAELSGRYRAEDYCRNLSQDHQAGRTQIVTDIPNNPSYTDTEKARYREIDIAAHIDVPLIKNNQFVALLAVHQSAPRQWTETEVKLVEETAEQTWAAVARAHAEAALRESEEKYRTLFESIDEGYFIADVIFDSDNRPIDVFYLKANPAVKRLTGLDLAGRSLREIDPNYESHWWEAFGRVAQTGIAERQELYAEPLKSWFSFYAFRVGDANSRRVAVVFQDITQRKQTEAALHEREQRLRIATEAAQLGVFEWQVLEDVTIWESDRLYEIYGLTPANGAVSSQDFFENYLHPDDTDALRAKLKEAMQTGFLRHTTYRIRRKDGTIRWIELNGQFEFAADGSPLRIVGVYADITDRIEAENALRQSEERYRTLVESIDDGFCVIEMLFDADDRPIDYLFLEINPSFEQQSGLVQAVGKRMLELAPHHEQYWFEFYGKVARTGEPVRYENYSEALNRWFDAYAFRLGQPENRTVGVLFKDISERKRAEAIMQRAAALDAFRVFLTDALRPLADPVEVQVTASRVLGEYLGANRVAYFEVRGGDYVVERDYVNGASAIAGSYPIDSFGPKLLAEYLAGRTVSVSDVAADLSLSPEQKSSYAAIQIGAYIGIPLMKEGKFVAGLAVHTAQARTWTPDEISLAEEVAERTWLAVERARAEAALRQSETRFRRIFECEMVPMAIYTKVGGIIEANNSLLNLIGYTRQELETGQISWQALTPPEYRLLDEMALSEIAVRGVSTPYEKVYLHKDGRRIPILIGAALLLEDASSGVFFAIDLTERKQAEAALQEQSQLMQLILTNIGDGLIMANRQGELILFNQAAERMFGRLTNERSPEEWSRTYGLYLPDRQTLFPDRQLPLYRAMQGEYASDVEVFVRRNPTDAGRWISISGFPVRDGRGDITGGVITCRDVSERKRILQQEQAAREEAERANRIKDEFLAVLSHELRSPLNPILGWTRLLQSGKLDAVRQREALATIERNAKLQTQLIEDLLDISRIMQGKMSLTITPVSLTFVISAAVETVRLAAEAKNIQIVLDFAPEVALVSGDAARLQQVVWNLLTNAVKFTPNNGQVTVELRQLDRLAQIRVIDTGKGINPQFLPHVFEYFRQEDGSTTRKFGGLGLGLAIARQIVEMHGGTVQAESQGEGQGATFIVQLPTMKQAASLGSEPIQTQTDARLLLEGIQILLVDDEPDTLEFQAFLLEQSGARVTAVASGLEALQALEQSIPDVLVSDIGMAQMDGYMLLQQIRSRPPNRGGTIPAIALTAYAAEIDRQQALQVGFQTHITKPVEPEVLVRAISLSLGRA